MSDAMTESPWRTKAEAAGYLGTTERFITRIIQEKRIRYYKVGRFTRFHVADLDAFAQPVEPRT